jgi:hypothetical protein
VELFEANNIGWAWWTIKKVDSESGLMNIAMPEGSREIIEYLKGEGLKPDADAAHKSLIQLTENVKIENCTVNYDVLDALFGR